MKTSCAMVQESIRKMQEHLYQEHNMLPDFHVTLTYDCKRDLLDDPEAFYYMPIHDIKGKIDTICGHGFSVVEEQELPYRIWIAGKVKHANRG